MNSKNKNVCIPKKSYVYILAVTLYVIEHVWKEILNTGDIKNGLKCVITCGERFQN